MKEYYKLRAKLKQKELELTEKLNEVLISNKIETHDAWFNFNESTLTIVFNTNKLTQELLYELQIMFGKIDYIYSNPVSDKLFVKFKRGE